MNGSLKSLQEIVVNLGNASLDPNTEVVVAPPTIYLLAVQAVAKSNIKVSAQNVYSVASGAYTGEISATMLKDVGIKWTLLGHSERRTLFGDTDELVAQKTKFALDTGISVILCVGETLDERNANQTIAVVERQLAAVGKVISTSDWSKVVIAYEPVWAIGTGKVATSAQAQEVHEQIRDWLKREVSPAVADATRIIYGGSVTAGNCNELGQQPDVDGFLVGGASLKPEFTNICNAKLK